MFTTSAREMAGTGVSATASPDASRLGEGVSS
jgi:hypothetical protein